ncbi:MAG: DUF502 domain-containing protein [bacterium]
MKQTFPAFQKPVAASNLARIRNKIFIGVMLATPVMATIWIFNFLLKLTTSWFPKTLFPRLDDLFHGYLLQVLVLLAVLVIFYLLGLLAHHFLGKRLYNLADRIFSGIPFIKNIYIFVRQVCEWVAKSRNTMFEAVVLVEYPRKGSYAIGLITAQTLSAITAKILDENGQPTECVNVFIATTPNPTTGMFLIFPRKDVIKLDMDVSEAMNLIISAGAILPQKTPESSRNSMLEMIDNLINKQAMEKEDAAE